MARWAPCKRRVFIRNLTRLGFSLPEPGGRHFYMRYGVQTLAIPSNTEYSVPQLKMLVKQGEHIIGTKISLGEWQNLQHLIFPVPGLFKNASQFGQARQQNQPDSQQPLVDRQQAIVKDCSTRLQPRAELHNPEGLYYMLGIPSKGRGRGRLGISDEAISVVAQFIGRVCLMKQATTYGKS